MSKRATTLFRKLLYSKDILELPGVYDAFSAKIAEKAGFNAITMGGYQVSASLLGEPGVGYLTLCGNSSTASTNRNELGER
ncbi:isocitrate lyase/phosphoenolpyruvate mutase family protein [Thermodesulfobium sp. 4217-1]|uniref:isocitrate lyase/phosphoenolpyruvate mutase family protein n=1 Tax=Thermodesulfobium sp. 4217-1 TaxID=3120013 RepID=UPI00322195C7